MKHKIFDQLIDIHPDGIIVVDSSGVVLFCNKNALNLFNKTEDKLLGECFGIPTVEFTCIEINQKYVEMRTTETIWKKKPSYFISVRDITERIYAINELKKAKEEAEMANRIREEIIKNMNHELRTPLNSIIGFSDIILTMKSFEYNNVHSYAEYINQSGWHLLEIIDEVLEMSNLKHNTELQEIDFDIEEIIQSVVDNMRSQMTRKNIVLDISSKPFKIFADKRNVKQMISHLLSNAIKFNNDNGLIQITVDQNSNKDLTVNVADTGIGMDLNAYKYETFGRVDFSLTSKTGGIGLGLTLTKTMIENHGGKLELKSVIGTGTVATLIFPKDRIL